MWCGCGPTEGAGTRTGQPFSTSELEPGAGSQVPAEWPKLGAPAITTQSASAPRNVVMNQSVWTAVWEQCDGSATLLDIQLVLRSRCELSPERAHDEVLSVVLQLEHDGLLSQIGHATDRGAA